MKHDYPITRIGNVEEKYVRYTFPSDRLGSNLYTLPGPGPGWIAHDERSLWKGEAVVYPRSTVVHRYVRWAGRRPQGWRGQMRDVLECKHLDGGLDAHFLRAGWGPLRSRTVPFEESKLPLGKRVEGGYTVEEGREPISDTPADPQSISRWYWNTNVDNPGGQLVSPYQGKAHARYWIDLWLRTRDRCTSAHGDPRLIDMDVVSERYSLLARFNPDHSALPNGSQATVPGPLRNRPLHVWLGFTGNAGYDAAHIWRQTHPQRALFSYYGSGPWEDDMLADGRDCTYWLSHLQARRGGSGENPYWMLGQSLYYHPLVNFDHKLLEVQSYRACGPNYGRALGECYDTVAWAYALAPDEFSDWADHALEYDRRVLASNPWGCFQSARSGTPESTPWGGPPPYECGVAAEDHAMADIEILKRLFGSCGIAHAHTGSDFPEEYPWLREAIDRHATLYLKNREVRGKFEAPKYWVTKRGGVWMTTPEPNPGGPVNGWGQSNEQQYMLYELALRFGSPKVSEWVRSFRSEFEDNWERDPGIRSHAAGLMGALA